MKGLTGSNATRMASILKKKEMHGLIGNMQICTNQTSQEPRIPHIAKFPAAKVIHASPPPSPVPEKRNKKIT